MTKVTLTMSDSGINSINFAYAFSVSRKCKMDTTNVMNPRNYTGFTETIQCQTDSVCTIEYNHSAQSWKHSNPYCELSKLYLKPRPGDSSGSSVQVFSLNSIFRTASLQLNTTEFTAIEVMLVAYFGNWAEIDSEAVITVNATIFG